MGCPHQVYSPNDMARDPLLQCCRKKAGLPCDILKQIYLTFMSMPAQLEVGWKASPRSWRGYKNKDAGLSAFHLLFYLWVKGVMRPPCAPPPKYLRTVQTPYTVFCLQPQHPLTRFVVVEGNSYCPRVESKDMTYFIYKLPIYLSLCS